MYIPQNTGTSSSGISGSSFSAQNEQAKVGIASRAPGIQQSAPPQNPYNAGNNNNPQTKIAEKKQSSLGDLSPLVFPPELSSEYYICFNAFKHSQTRPTELKRKFSFSKSVYLPLPTNITDSYSAAYNAENLFIGGELTRKGIEAVMQKDGTSSLSNAFQNINVEGAGKLLATGMEKFAGDPAGIAKKALASAAVLAMSQSSSTLASAARASFQVSTNPFPVMIFQGTSFKPPFSFDWTFYPESFEESQVIRKIVGYFRREMLPETMEGNESILKTPAIFDIKMKPDAHTRVFKKCVLKDMAVNYAPNGPSFINNALAENLKPDSTKLPAAISLSLTFQEIEVWLADDYYEDEFNSFGPRDRQREAAEAAQRPPNSNALGVQQQSDTAREASTALPGGI